MVLVESSVRSISKKAAVGDLRSFVAPALAAGLPDPNGSGKGNSGVRMRTHPIREVVILEAGGRLSDVAKDLDEAVSLALADRPRGVVCDLTAMLEGAEPGTLEALASIGRHVRDWPGTPVAVACPDPQVREVLAAHPLGGHLIVAGSLFSAITAVLSSPSLTTVSRRLAPHPTAPRASREFVTRTLLDWRLGRVIPFASLVVSELVTSSTHTAGTDIELSVTWDRGALRLTVRDHGPALPDQRPSGLDLRGRGFAVVSGLSRAFGVLPATDGGRVVWAVLDATRPAPSSRRVRSEPAPVQGSPVFTDGRGLAELPFCAGSSRPPV